MSPAPGNADYTVFIVDSAGEADMSVAVVGDNVVDISTGATGDVLTIQPDGSVAPAAPSGASGGPYPADAVGATIGTVSGSGDLPDYQWVQFPTDPGDEHAVAAWGLQSDDFPRVVFCVEGWYFGDGTFDPYLTGAEFRVVVGTFQFLAPLTVEANLNIQGGTLNISGGGGIHSFSGTFDGDVTVDDNAAGLILRSPDNTKHRIKVANDGSLSTEVVA